MAGDATDNQPQNPVTDTVDSGNSEKKPEEKFSCPAYDSNGPCIDFKCPTPGYRCDVESRCCPKTIGEAVKSCSVDEQPDEQICPEGHVCLGQTTDNPQCYKLDLPLCSTFLQDGSCSKDRPCDITATYYCHKPITFPPKTEEHATFWQYYTGNEGVCCPIPEENLLAGMTIAGPELEPRRPGEPCIKEDYSGPSVNTLCPPAAYYYDDKNNWCCPNIKGGKPKGPCKFENNGIRKCPGGQHCIGPGKDGRCYELDLDVCSDPKKQAGECKETIPSCPDNYSCIGGMCCENALSEKLHKELFERRMPQ
ncbi:hypothetical protein Ddc_02723 [Ditylenchus destructor]|nr:hypothetical protein Ddc_02723 [Ditylenchus destructor]